MFREMRRRAQQLTEKDAYAVLDRNTHGVLAVAGDNGYPYAVPLSYARLGNTIYFHCAAQGHKLDAIAAQPKVSFAVVDADNVVGAEFTTYYRSAIVFGRAAVVTAEEERQRAFSALMEKYCEFVDMPARRATVERSGAKAAILRLDIERITAKEANELVLARRDTPEPPRQQ